MKIEYIAQCTLDPRYGWSEMSAVPPCSTLEEAKREGLEYLGSNNWPEMKLRVVKRTTKVVWTQGGIK